MKKQIVFIEGYYTVVFYKLAKLFKKNEYETVLIRFLEQIDSDKEFYNQAYDKVIDFKLDYHKVTPQNVLKILASNLKKLNSTVFSIKGIFQLNPYVIIGRAPKSIPLAIFRILFKKTPFVYFPYDIHCQTYKTLEQAKKDLPLLEIKADRFCFEHSDGIIHKGAPHELSLLNGRMLGDNIKLPKHQIAFHPYCAEEFMVPINKNKLSKKMETYTLYMSEEQEKKSKEFYFSQLKCYEEIIKQKMHIHFHFCSAIAEEKDSEKDMNIIKEFNEIYKDYPNIKYFHLERPLSPREISKEISRYDYGVVPYEVIKSSLEPAVGTGNKIATYLEAGIPCIYRKEHIFTNKLRAKYHLDIVYPDNIKDLKKMIKNLDYKKLERNVLKMRKEFLMEKQFSRLETFIKNVVKSKKGNN